MLQYEVLNLFKFSICLSLSTEEVCHETVPAILGLSRAMKSTAKCRAKAFREICGLEEEGEGEGGGGGGEREFELEAEDIIQLKNVVSCKRHTV